MKFDKTDPQHMEAYAHYIDNDVGVEYFSDFLQGWMAHKAAQAAQPAQPMQPAMELFRKNPIDDDCESLERLRYFCSLAMTRQDWIDVEQFFDAVAAQPACKGCCADCVPLSSDGKFVFIDGLGEVPIGAHPAQIPAGYVTIPSRITEEMWSRLDGLVPNHSLKWWNHVLQALNTASAAAPADTSQKEES